VTILHLDAEEVHRRSSTAASAREKRSREPLDLLGRLVEDEVAHSVEQFQAPVVRAVGDRPD
jgi:hypothetical protein